jgi:hypothetical protein
LFIIIGVIYILLASPTAEIGSTFIVRLHQR